VGEAVRPPWLWGLGLLDLGVDLDLDEVSGFQVHGLDDGRRDGHAKGLRSSGFVDEDLADEAYHG